MIYRKDRMNGSEIRSICKKHIESLEHWLRRLIDDKLKPAYGDDYFFYRDEKENNLIPNRIKQQIEIRIANEKNPRRYPRKIDAALLGNVIEIICKPILYKDYFGDALIGAFPQGREAAKFYLERIMGPRNSLAHANSISSRHAEQVVCYSNDVIESLKAHYAKIGQHQAYNVPLILKVTDSFGNTLMRNQFSDHMGGIYLNFSKVPSMFLRSGDTLTLELEVDPSFDPESYNLEWSSSKSWSPAKDTDLKVVIPITNKQVGVSFDVICSLIYKNDWHRLDHRDDLLLLKYRVLPPLD